MHALSVRQPYAEQIASGAKRREYRTWAPRILVGGDLLIVASRTPGEGYAGEPQGVAICVVHVARISGIDGDYAWHLEGVRRVAPIAIKGSAALFRVDETELRFVKPLATDGAAAARAARLGAPARPRASRAKVGPYTFSIGDRDIRGESAPHIVAARMRARELVLVHGTGITILRDGLAIGGES